MRIHCERVLPGLLAAMVAGACDDSFQPIDDSGPPFSIFGYLDASADTQFIRINKLPTMRLVHSPDPTGIAVTIEHLEAGTTIALRDSAMLFPDMIGSGTVYAHNFWTAERIEPGATYRFRAERDGDVAESTVEIPRDYLLEVWVRQSNRWKYIHVEGVKHLPFIFWFDSHDEACIASRACRFWTTRNLVVDSVAENYWVDSARARTAEIVVSGGEWPFGGDRSVFRLAPDSAGSGVQSALGLLRGLLRKQVWVEDCLLPSENPRDTYCKLRYDSTTATLRGQVSSSCGVPLDSVGIELRELEPPAGERPRTRFSTVDTLGNYDIGAIRPGGHQLTVTRARYYPGIDTLHINAGQEAHHSIVIKPLAGISCPNYRSP